MDLIATYTEQLIYNYQCIQTSEMKNDTVFGLLVKSLNNDERSICLIYHCLRFCNAYKIKKSIIPPVMKKLV